MLLLKFVIVVCKSCDVHDAVLSVMMIVDGRMLELGPMSFKTLGSVIPNICPGRFSDKSA